MKKFIALTIILASVSSYASQNKVQIEIKADTKEICMGTADAAELLNVERNLKDKYNMQIVEISNCNKMLNGKFKKTVKFVGTSQLN